MKVAELIYVDRNGIALDLSTVLVNMFNSE